MGNIAQADPRLVPTGMTRRGALYGAAATVGGVAAGSLLHPTVAEAASIDGYINVKDEGAVGNGSTNDTGAFQAAIDAAASLSGGGVVYVPATSASYRISQIRLKANVWLLGNGARSVLRSVDNNPNTYMVILDSATARDVWITDLQLTCTKQNQSFGNPGGVLFDNTGQTGDHRHHLERLFVNNFKRDGLHFAGAARTVFIRDSYIGSCDGHGMVFESEATDNVIEGVMVGNSGLHGILNDASTNRFVGNKVFLSGKIDAVNYGDGFHISGSQAVGVLNEAQSNQRHGFHWNGSQRNLWRACTSDTNSGVADHGFLPTSDHRNSLGQRTARA